jgi:IS30 family transposase
MNSYRLWKDQDLSRRPHNIKYRKVTSEIQETILDLLLSKRFGCSSRIKFRLRRTVGLSLSTRTIYKILNRHGLDILKCKARTRTYKRFAMKHISHNISIPRQPTAFLLYLIQHQYISLILRRSLGYGIDMIHNSFSLTYNANR